MTPVSRVITPAQARAEGLTPARFRRLRPLFYGVRLRPGVRLDLPALVEGARTFLPSDAVATGVTALRLQGAPVGQDLPLRFVSTTDVRRRRDSVSISVVDQLPDQVGDRVAAPADAFLDVWRHTPLVGATIIGDRLVQLGYVSEQAALRIDPLVRTGAESPQETRLRLAIVLAGLPEPELQAVIHCDGSFVGRVDLCYRRFGVVIEYEGDQHRERNQWDKDITRYERLIKAGWIVIRVTAARMRDPSDPVAEVYRALHSRGYRGAPPRTGAEWLALLAS